MTTHQSDHGQHRSRHFGVLRGRQFKRRTIRRSAVRLWLRRFNRFVDRPGRRLVRTSLAHAGQGHQPIAITQNKFLFLKLFIAVVLSLAFGAQSAFAHDPPVILPTRLDFDASQASKNCNDQDGFRSILGSWVPVDVLRDDAERRLIVSIQSSARGSKRADVSLVDERGVTVAERHTPYATTHECYKVLWAVARDAAKMLGAFEPPPPKEPVVCPASPACASCPPPRPCFTVSSLRRTTPTPTVVPTPYRSFIGLGGFVGSGIFSEMAGGPSVLLGFSPSTRLSQMHIELHAAWTSQTSQSIRLHSIPLDTSLCWIRGIVQFCGGLSTTFLFTNQSFTRDELQFMLGGNLRLGTELFRHGSFAIRADIFGRLHIAPRQFAQVLGVMDEPTPFAGGVAVMGVWAFE